MQITDVPNGYIHLGKSRCRDASSRGVVAGKAIFGHGTNHIENQ